MIDRPELVVASGQDVAPIRLDPAAPLIIGRGSAAGMRLDDPAVSRLHARLERKAGSWIITDLDSRHGTTLNGARLTPNAPAPLASGDEIRIGAWLLIVDPVPQARSTVMTQDDEVDSTRASVERLERESLGSLASRRLDLLIQTAAELNSAEGEREIAQRAVRTLLTGTGFGRAAAVRPIHGFETLEVLAYIDHQGSTNPVGQASRLSRTLLAAAGRGDVVQMRRGQPLMEAVSVLELGLVDAMCLPVRVAGSVDALLYLDSDVSSGRPFPDAAAFASAVADLYGFALSNFARIALERRQQSMMRDLMIAREVQGRLMPPPSARLNGLRYCVRAIAGRHVAGDLFGMVHMSAQRTAVFLGDVAGKGLAAGILMATAQAHLETMLARGAELVEAMDSLNVFVSDRSVSSEFITLFACVLDRGAGELRCVDAGHGYAALVRPDGSVETINAEGGVPIGVEETTAYGESVIPLAPGSRVVIASDGIIEQTNGSRAQFGWARVLETLRASRDPDEDVAKLIEALTEHAGGTAYDDDVTVASVEVERR